MSKNDYGFTPPILESQRKPRDSICLPLNRVQLVHKAVTRTWCSRPQDFGPTAALNMRFASDFRRRRALRQPSTALRCFVKMSSETLPDKGFAGFGRPPGLGTSRTPLLGYIGASLARCQASHHPVPRARSGGADALGCDRRPRSQLHHRARRGSRAGRRIRFRQIPHFSRPHAPAAAAGRSHRRNCFPRRGWPGARSAPRSGTRHAPPPRFADRHDLSGTFDRAEPGDARGRANRRGRHAHTPRWKNGRPGSGRSPP